jgi:hypothetical protein
MVVDVIHVTIAGRSLEFNSTVQRMACSLGHREDAEIAALALCEHFVSS